LQIVDAVRDVWPSGRPVFARVSATDWVDGGWDINEAVEFAKLLRDHGVDLIDTSSGGNDPAPKIRLGPGYQVPFARRIREQVGVPTAAVGLITEAVQAEEMLRTHAADAIMIARAHLDDPYWVRRAALELGAEPIRIAQYDRPDLGRKQSTGNPGPGRGS
jgi:2,4-dienoyl-CoA reductase-like NADH-dependent reductase (Old Yellow Enzyme family)